MTDTKFVLLGMEVLEVESKKRTTPYPRVPKRIEHGVTDRSVLEFLKILKDILGFTRLDE
jgi:hypothetical protein